MGKKMKLPLFLSHSKSLDPNDLSPSPPWPFPSCGHIKTISFRATNALKDDAFRTFNSAFLDPEMTPPDSFFTVSSSSRSFSTMSEDEGDPTDESVIRGLRSSDRLFFDPHVSSSLVSLSLDEKEEEEEEGVGAGERVESMDSGTTTDQCNLNSNEFWRVESMESASDLTTKTISSTRVVYKESEMFSLESSNPYEDFRRSMEEMVEAHGLKDWQGLEELLACYLKINGKNNHGYIMGAFIDILVNLSFESLPSTSTQTPTTTITSSSHSLSSTNFNYSSPSSPLSLPSSSITTPCLSSILDHGDGDDDDDDGDENDEEKGSDDELHDDDDNDGVDLVSS